MITLPHSVLYGSLLGLALLLSPWSASVAQASCPHQPNPPAAVAPVPVGETEIHAWWSGAADDDFWHLHITRPGTTYLEVFNKAPSGQTKGQWRLPPTAIADLVNQGALKSFEQLPASIEAPNDPKANCRYTISVQTPNGKYEVRLQVGQQPLDSTDAQKRFWAAWNAIWALVPVRPPAPSALPVNDKKRASAP